MRKRRSAWMAGGLLALATITGGMHTPGHALAAPAAQQPIQGDRYIAQAVTDRDGNIIIVGFFQGTLDLGSGPVQSNGRYDVLLAKLDKNGAPIWSKLFGDADEQFGAGVVVDTDGSITITGEFSGAIDFGGGPLVSAGAEDIFVAKFDADGAPLWAKRFGDADSQTATALALAPGGATVIAGQLSGEFATAGEPLLGAGGQDVLLFKLASDGELQWARRFGDSETQSPAAVAVDPLGNATVVGRFAGRLDVGGTALASAGGYDAFVANFGPDGATRWAKSFGDAESQAANAVAIAADGSVLVAGQFTGTINLGGETLRSAGGFDAFVVRLIADGSHRFSARSGDVGDQFGVAIAAGPEGGVYLVESVEQVSAAGPSALTLAPPSWSMVVSRFDTQGVRQWSQPFAEGSLTGTTVALLSADAVLAGGYLETGLEMGDIVLKELDGAGALRWERRLGG